MKKVLFYTVGLLVVVIFTGVLINRFIKKEERRLKESIIALEKAIEEGDKNKVMRFVADEYKDEYGNDYASISQLAGELFREFDNIEVKIKEIKIKLMDYRAITRIKLQVFGRYEDSKVILFGEALSPSSVVLYWQKQGDTWRVMSATQGDSLTIGILEGIP